MKEVSMPPRGVEPLAGTGKTVAVTGASGFIGARLVTLLREQLGHDVADVRAFARRSRGPSLSGLRLDDAEAVSGKLSGCDALVHCAFDFHDMAKNLRMIRVLGRACAEGSTRLVLLSTAAVYEPFPVGTFNETAPIEPVGVPYSDAKICIEEEVIQQSRTLGLHVVILQPTLVYGPRCRQWIDTPVRELLSGRVVLPQEGEGTCNAVYVDDVCAAVMAAVNADIPSGERFLVNGPNPVTWSGFYSALRDTLGTGAISFTPRTRAVTQPTHPPPDPQSTVILKRMAARIMGSDARANLKFALQRLRSRGGEIVHMPHGAKLDLYSSSGIASTASALQSLGWRPRIDFAQGIALTTDYIHSKFAAQIRNSLRRDARYGKPEAASSQPSETSARWLS